MENKQLFYFVVGSQHLYGEETLNQVAENAKGMVADLNASGKLPFMIVLQPTVKDPQEALDVMVKANTDDACLGVITWMHTFSPSKMWIAGLKVLSKPYMHLHTQANRDIPVEEIDMDFMNLNQSAHGDREHGFIATRLRLNRAVISGYYKSERVLNRLAVWMRAALGVAESKQLKVCRFGDNMREVAVTEGDKVEAQIKFGWSVNTYAVGDLVKEINAVTEDEVNQAFDDVKDVYDVASESLDAIKYQLKEEIAMQKFLDKRQCKAFTNTFEDLHGMEQLPGLATQNLMRKGYGYGGEGDWKTSAMVRIMKKMAEGLEGGTSFMEDYTYHYGEDEPIVLGAHMLEICPSIAKNRPKIEVHELGIGGKNPPARLVFESGVGDAIHVSLIDMGNRFRMIVAECEVIPAIADMPKLPVARTMWKLKPNFEIGTEAWIYSGGAHHTVLSFALSVEHMRYFAEMMNIEFIHIGKNTTIESLKQTLAANEVIYAGYR